MRRLSARHTRKTNRRIRIAPIAFCAAVLLLGKIMLGRGAQLDALLRTLASHERMIAHVLTLETGLFVHDIEVFTPAPRTSARTELAQSPSEEVDIVPTVPEAAPVLQTADRAATVTINNETDYEVDVAACLSAAPLFSASTQGPRVLIVHTHGSESYRPDTRFPYTPIENTRTTDSRYNVLRVGEELKQVLAEHGIEAIQIRQLFDSPAYAGSYDRSLTAIEQALEQYPSIELVLDLHRDSILTAEGEEYKTLCTIEDTPTAQLMFVVGTDAGGLYHPNWEQNLSAVCQLQYQLNRHYPGLMRAVNLRTQRFNQHTIPGAMLVEVGSSGNTLPEALAATRLLGQEIAAQLTHA